MRLSKRHKKELTRVEKKKKKVLNGWAIVRVSKENLAFQGSPEQQQNMINDWVAVKNKETGKKYNIIKIINEEASGRYQNTHKRKEILHLLHLIETGMIDFLVAERLDRISRDEVLNLQLMRLVRDKGVELHEVNYGELDFRDRGQRMGYKYRNVEAGEYSEGVSENVDRKQMVAMVHNGKDPSPCPILGLDPHPRWVGYYVPNWDEVKIANKIMEIFVKRGKEGAIKYCKDNNIKTKAWFTKEKVKNGERIPSKKMGGKDFDWQSMSYFLGNPKVRGINYIVDVWDQFKHIRDKDKIVKWEYWHRKEYGDIYDSKLVKLVDEKLQRGRKNRPRNNEFYLSGILHDKNGSRYSGEAAKSGKQLYYLNRKTGKRLDAMQANKIVIGHLKELISKDGFLEKLISRIHKSENDPVQSLRNEREGVKQKIDKLRNVIENFSISLREIVASRQENLGDAVKLMVDEQEKAKSEIIELEARILELDKKEKLYREKIRGSYFKNHVNEVLKNFDTLHSLEKKFILETIIPYVEINTEDEENSAVVYYNLGIDQKSKGDKNFLKVKNNGEDTKCPLPIYGGRNKD